MTRCVAFTGVLLLSATMAQAHVTVQPRESKPGATETYTVRVPTEGQVTTNIVELEVPAGVTIVTVNGAPGTVEQKESGGRVTSITWKVEIAPAQSQELTFVARNPASGTEIAWKAHQRYSDGTSTDWVEPAGSRRPGPVTRLIPVQ